MIILTLSGVLQDESGAPYYANAQERNKNPYSTNTTTSSISINAKGAILIEQESGKILFEKDGNKKMYPASTTKILTALIAIEYGELDEVITVGDEIALMDSDGSRAWLRIGEKMKLSNLLMGLLLPSGNDAAYTIALNIGRKISNNPSLKREDAINIFVNKMNERAKEIGAINSNFVNPHGFHNNEHYSTPYDLALIASEAFKYDFFKQIAKTYSYEGINTNNQGHKWENTNQLLNKGSKNYYKYATGIKTGHTTPAGYCLVSSGSKDNMDVIAVVLNTTPAGQWGDSKTLLDYGLNNFTHHVVVKKGDILQAVKVINKRPWDKLDLDLIARDNYEEVFNKSDISNVQWSIEWNSELIKPSVDTTEGVKILSSLEKGEVIGKAIYTLNGEVLGEINIEAGRDIKRNYIIFNLPGMTFIYENRKVIVPVLLFFILALTLINKRSKKKNKRRKR
jgi:D-alanyl-D-alanine carboxypeptidase (penicillin-binding protein 5/6)